MIPSIPSIPGIPGIPSITGQGRNLTISGSFPDGQFSIDLLRGSESLGAPFQLTLSLLSDSADIDISSLVGDTMTVTVEGEKPIGPSSASHRERLTTDTRIPDRSHRGLFCSLQR
jgi:uncharacterized protein involved in type VI secretion and phage assembly